MSLSKRLRRFSLKGLLLCLLLPGMLASLALDSYDDYQTLAEITRTAYDQILQMPVAALGRSLTIQTDGRPRIDTELIADQIVEAGWKEPIQYQIRVLGANPQEDPDAAREGARVILGALDLPLPPEWQSAQEPAIAFYDTHWRGTPHRVAAQVRRLSTKNVNIHVLVQAAQSSVERKQAERVALRQASWRDARAVGVVALLLWLGITLGLRPLSRLRAEIAERKPDDTTPLDSTTVPQEVVPLVEAVNHHIARHRDIVRAQSQFLADASHQLRTPLAIMQTQAEYALREKDPRAIREGVNALRDRLDNTRRLTSQLLNLSLADHASSIDAGPFDLSACGRDVLVEYLPLAEARRIDLGWEDTTRHTIIAHGRYDGIREAVSNLIHNALQYTAAGGSVTVSCGYQDDLAWLRVVDNGIGIPPLQRGHAFDRFVRLDGTTNQSDPGGAGLGLAIARAFIRRDGGDITLDDGEPNPQDKPGLSALLILPRGHVALQHDA